MDIDRRARVPALATGFLGGLSCAGLGIGSWDPSGNVSVPLVLVVLMTSSRVPTFFLPALASIGQLTLSPKQLKTLIGCLPIPDKYRYMPKTCCRYKLDWLRSPRRVVALMATSYEIWYVNTCKPVSVKLR